MKKPNMIIIDARRWFQKSYGNTYHSVTVTVDGVSLGNSGIHYGYGDHYLQTASAMLEKAGYFEDWNDFCTWRRSNHEKCYVAVSDVARERDLK